jgi:hypothetical protein
MRNHIIKLIIIGTLAFTHGYSFAQTDEIQIYVAKNGRDTWSGSLNTPNNRQTDGPFASLEAARNKIRSFRSNSELLAPVIVNVREGIYYLNNTFILETQDSGTRNYPITFRAYPGQKIIISGGKKISQTWKKFKDKIMVCTIPDVKNRNWIFHELYVNGQRQTRAHTPDTGYFFMAELIDDQPASFKFNKGEMKILNMKQVRGKKSKVLFDIKTFTDWQHMGYDFHSIITDPLFIDPENDDYRLHKNSPAFKLGFKPIDISTVGPLKE